MGRTEVQKAAPLSSVVTPVLTMSVCGNVHRTIFFNKDFIRSTDGTRHEIVGNSGAFQSMSPGGTS
jgi:hypothetical protein